MGSASTSATTQTRWRDRTRRLEKPTHRRHRRGITRWHAGGRRAGLLQRLSRGSSRRERRKPVSEPTLFFAAHLRHCTTVAVHGRCGGAVAYVTVRRSSSFCALMYAVQLEVHRQLEVPARWMFCCSVQVRLNIRVCTLTSSFSTPSYVNDLDSDSELRSIGGTGMIYDHDDDPSWLTPECLVGMQEKTVNVAAFPDGEDVGT